LIFVTGFGGLAIAILAGFVASFGRLVAFLFLLA
jgi:hypothetical protein